MLVEARQAALGDHRRDLLVQAYQVAELAGFRSKMPRLKDVLRRWEPRAAITRKMTTEEIEAALDARVRRDARIVARTARG